MNELGIYCHIPFCRSKCGYCDFYSLPGCSDKLMDDYVEALIRQVGEFFPTPGQLTADTIYIGGGTPSVLGGKRIARLLKELTKRVNFMRGCEITLEVNPESVDKALLKAARAAGVNRVSMGLQSADNHALYALGRLHTAQRAAQAVGEIAQYCTENIGVDLMYGLPGQTMESWQHSVQTVLTMPVKSISCYGLKLEPGTPMYSQQPLLPDDDAQAEMYLWAVEALGRAGFAQYEISNFARPGYASRHNEKYWDLSDYVGFGCGAHSFYGGRRFACIRDVEGYIAGMAGKGSVLAEADDTPFFGRVGEYVMLRLRTTAGISEGDFVARFKQDFRPFEARLRHFVSSGHAVQDGDRWYLTPAGFLVSNRIIGDVLEACGVEVQA